MLTVYSRSSTAPPVRRLHFDPLKKAAGLLWMFLVLLGMQQAQAQIKINGVDTPHTTIQAAVNAAVSGDVIQVAAGTYSETVTIATAGITLQGAQHGVDPRPSVGSARTIGVGETIVFVTGTNKAVNINADNVTIDGFQIEQTGSSSTGRAIETDASHSGIIFINNIVTNTGAGDAMRLHGGEGFTISQNYFNNIQSVAIWLRNGNALPTAARNQKIINNDIIDVRGTTGGAMNLYGLTDLEISGNYIESKYQGISIGTALDAPYYTMYEIDVHHNTILTELPPGTGAARHAVVVTGIGNDIKIRENIIAQSGAATTTYPLIRIGFDENPVEKSNPSGVVITNNHLSMVSGSTGKYIYLAENITNHIQATCNWFGVNNGAMIAGLVSDRAITFAPWLADGTDNNGTAIGFEPVANSCSGNFPVKVFSDAGLTNLRGTYSTIQAAISAGSTVNSDFIVADAGTYSEGTINVNKSVTILGANVGKDGTDATRVAESIILDTKVNLQGTNTIVLDGFKIKAVDITGNVVVLEGSTIGTVQNSVFERFGSASIPSVRAIATSAGVGKKVIKGNWFMGDPTNYLVGDLHKTWAGGIYINANGGTKVDVLNNTFNHIRSGLNIDDVTDFQNGIVLSGNKFQNIVLGFAIGGNTVPSGSHTLGANDFLVNGTAKHVMLYLVNQNFRLDLSSSTFSGQSPAIMSDTELFAVEAGMVHKGSWPSGTYFEGLVIYKPGHSFAIHPTHSIDASAVVKIQGSVNYASPGDIIHVEPGVFNENITVDKSVTLLGANANVSCGSRDTESEIVGGGASESTTVKVNADGVTINGFKITNPLGSNGVQASGRSNLRVIYNAIENIGDADNGFFSSAGIQFEASANTSGVDFSNNCISNIRGGRNASNSPTNGSSFGIGIHSSNSTSSLTGLTISNNHISNISASTPDDASGKGAYGIMTNVGASNATGVVSGSITNNTIESLNGRWSHGVGLAGNTPAMSVINNDVKNLASAGGNAVGLNVENNNNADGVTANNNSFTGTMTYGVFVNSNSTGTVNATCNWYGAPDMATIAPKVAGTLTFTPWLISGLDENGASIGFIPTTNACTGLGPVRVYQDEEAFTNNPGAPNSTHITIQAAVDAASNGNAIVVSNGTYTEQVVVHKAVTIQGESRNGVVLQPATVFDPNNENRTSISLKANNIKVENLTVTKSGIAIGVDKDTEVSDFELDNVSISHSRIGVFSGASSPLNVFSGVKITNTSFDNTDFVPGNGHKAIYLERASDLTIDGITVNNVGNGSTTPYSGGVDINLKEGSYSNINILNSTFTGTAVSGPLQTSGGLPFPEGGGAIQVKSTTPVSGVKVEGNTVSGAYIALSLGMTNQSLIRNNKLDGVHRAVVNQGTGNAVLICNWLGSSDVDLINTERLHHTQSGSGNYFTLVSYASDASLSTCESDCNIKTTNVAGDVVYVNGANIPQGTLKFSTAAGFDSYQWYACNAGASGCTFTDGFTPNGGQTQSVSRAFTQIGFKGIRVVRTVAGVTQECIFTFRVIPTITSPVPSGCSVVLRKNGGGGVSQWYKDNVLIEGATADTYTATSNGTYRVEVGGLSGPVGAGQPFVSADYVVSGLVGTPEFSFTYKEGDADAVTLANGAEVDVCQGTPIVLGLTGTVGDSYVLVRNLDNVTVGSGVISADGLSYPFTAGLTDNSAYSITVSRGACSVTKTFTLDVNPAPGFVLNANSSPLANESTTTYCEGEPVSFALTGDNGTYELKLNGNVIANGSVGDPLVTFSATSAYAGVYELTVTTPEGCSATQIYTIEVAPKPVFALAANEEVLVNGATTTYCEGKEVSFKLTGDAGSYILKLNGNTIASGNVGDDVATFPATVGYAGSYELEVTSGSTGCKVTHTYIIEITPKATMDAIDNEIVIIGNSFPAIPFVSSLTGVTYSWVVSGDPIAGLPGSGSGAEFPSFTPTSTGTATVTVTPSVNGCDGDAVVFEIVVQESPDLRPYVLMNNTGFSNSITTHDVTILVRNVKSGTIAYHNPITLRIYKPHIQSQLALSPASEDIWSLALDGSGLYYILTTNEDIPSGAANQLTIEGTLTVPASVPLGRYVVTGYIPTGSSGEATANDENNESSVVIYKN